jgi:hypothetical protein
MSRFIQAWFLSPTDSFTESTAVNKAQDDQEWGFVQLHVRRSRRRLQCQGPRNRSHDVNDAEKLRRLLEVCLSERE